MTEGRAHELTTLQQPRRPLMRGAQKYDVLRDAEAATKSAASKPSPEQKPQREEVFTVTFIATKEKGASMDDESKFLIELIFKPNEGKLRLRPQETQILLAYYAELMKEIEEEEKLVIEEEKSKQKADE